MKSINRIFISICALGLLASVPALRAQEPSAPPAEGQGGGKGGKGGRGGMMSPEGRVSAIEAAVGKLTDDQKAKITEIITKQQKDMQALGRDATREQRMEISQAANKDIREVLTPDQQTKFDAMPPPGRGGKKKGGN